MYSSLNMSVGHKCSASAELQCCCVGIHVDGTKCCTVPSSTSSQLQSEEGNRSFTSNGEVHVVVVYSDVPIYAVEGLAGEQTLCSQRQSLDAQSCTV